MNSPVNYQKQFDGVIAGLGGRVPTLLLHDCCAPCASAVLEILAPRFSVTLFYYDPNISPEAEYRRRADEAKRLLAVLPAEHPVSFREGAYDPERFAALAKGHENDPERGGRCTLCYRLRLTETARYAAEHGFEYFATTLTLSPYKDAARLNAIGAELEKEFGVKYLPSDFKKRGGYQRSLELSRVYGLYRQNTCGCVYSARDRKEKTDGNGT